DSSSLFRRSGLARRGALGDDLRRRGARSLIQIVNSLKRIKITPRQQLEGALDRRGYIEKADLAAEKSVDGGFIGGVEHGRATRPGQGLARQPQGWEALGIGGSEGQPADRGQIDPLRRGRRTLGPGKRMSDRGAPL